MNGQASLFGRHGTPDINPRFPTLRRHWLLPNGTVSATEPTPMGTDSGWLDHANGWLQGHEVVFDSLQRETSWQETSMELYEKVVGVPRLVASIPENGPGHPVFARIGEALRNRYGVAFTNVGLALYRDGRDSVAWHGDRVARDMPVSTMAIVSVGAPRRFLLRPQGGGRSLAFKLGWGDLVVMGGSCQRTWQHTVPKAARVSGPRIAIMFRPRWSEPEDG